MNECSRGGAAFVASVLLHTLLAVNARYYSYSQSASGSSEEPAVEEQQPPPIALQDQLLGWTKWSEWSTCPAKCGIDSVQFQLRRCLDLYCSGPSARHRVCAQPDQCALDNNRSSSPISSYHDPVTIECSLRSTPKESLVPATNHDCSLQCLSPRTNQVHAFNVSLHDGTKCRLERDHSQRAVCLAGKCRSVGCDGLVGSVAREDQCGVCGGDGTSCAGELFRWRDTGHFSPCDKSCGPDSVRVSVSVCVNTNTEKVVPERMCADQARPRPQVRRCAQVVCPHKWLTGEWGECSATCGVGEQQREVFCAEQMGQERRRVADQYCWQTQRPIDVRKCGADACPEWAVGEWGECSVSCGRGIRRRPVECRRGDTRFHELHCLSASAAKKPTQEQPCWTGISCPQRDDAREPNAQQGNEPKKADVAEHAQKERAPMFSYSEANGNGEERPKFSAGAWGECSASCGAGIRSRVVECVARQSMGQQLSLPDYECQGQAKPSQFQPCQLAPCPVRSSSAQSAIRSLSEPFGDISGGASAQQQSSLTPPQFRWEHGEWTLCSASCLGGKQRSPVLCMDVQRRVAVPWTNCEEQQAGKRPQELVRACNRHSCPPDWEIGPWSACSHACGGGLRTRRVRCVRAVSRRAEASTLILPDAQCPGERPGDEEPCGMVDCPAEWTTGQWSQCSTSCGSTGEQRREIHCVRRDSLGQVRELTSTKEALECAKVERPPTVRLCNLGPCLGSSSNEHDGALSYAEGPFGDAPPPQSLPLVQRPQQDEPMDEEEDKAAEQRGPRRLTLSVGGFANLDEGISLKVKCPLKGGDRKKVAWSKDGRRMTNGPHIKVSANGALRIFHARQSDAGVYACRTADGSAHGNITLQFKPSGGASHKPTEGNQTKQKQREQKGMELLQRVRDSLYRLGEHALYERLSTARDPSKVRVEYAASAWGECIQNDCTLGEGAQVRHLKCQIHVGHSSASVEDAICEAFGVTRPPATRPCADPRCPQWQPGSWSECTESRCIRQGTGIQRREVRCAYENGTLADATQCNRKTRPKLKRECENANCSAEWRPSVWGQCSKACGDGGVQMRLLRCVWHGTRKPAGRNCEPTLRPTAIRACETGRRALPQCPEEEEEDDSRRTEPQGDNGTKQRTPSYSPPHAAALNQCEDKSRFCDIIRLFQSCDQAHIRAQCCYSCRVFGQRKGGGRRH